MDDFILIGLIAVVAFWLLKRLLGGAGAPVPNVDLRELGEHLKKVLVADDSVTIQKVVELTFMDCCTVVAVGSGGEAVEALDRDSYGLVIADVHMGTMSGYDVCRHVKTRRPEVPVVLLCGTFEPFDEKQYRSCAADATVKKPFDSRVLLGEAARLCVPEHSEHQLP